MPLEKIPAILLIVFGFNMTYRAPAPPPPKDKRRTESDAIEISWLEQIPKVSDWLLPPKHTPNKPSAKAACYLYAIIELCIILGGMRSNEFAARLLPDGKNPDCIRLTPTTACATLLVVLGSLLRYWCFREMGRHFTIHVTLVKDHKLITTGPYGIVRHPSYTGVIFMLVGKGIWYGARGSWLRESMVYQMKASWLVISPVIFIVPLVFVMILRRVPAEDAMLKREFGKEWDRWAKEVPYRLFPGII